MTNNLIKGKTVNKELTQKQLFRGHREWGCIGVCRTVVCVIWMVSEGRLAEKDALAFLELIGKRTDETRPACSYCEDPTPVERYRSYVQNPEIWRRIAQHLFGVDAPTNPTHY